jgi:Zn-finger nucleic acid-binding protein
MTKKLHCVCEAHTELDRAELAPGLPALRCATCHGHWLVLADHARWNAVAVPAPAGDEDVPPMRPEVGATARHCPACERLMARYRVGSTPDFRLDRCAPCQAVWLDAGEWPALHQAGLAHRLADVLSDAWQRRVQTDELSARRLAALQTRHGAACMDELARMRAWLDTQPHRDELLAMLRAGW